MQTSYRLKVQDLSAAFLKALKASFAGQEVEITIKSVKPENHKHGTSSNSQLSNMIKESRTSAPVISPNADIRALIDDSQCPSL